MLFEHLKWIRDVLKCLSINNKIADAALDVISLCLMISTSSTVPIETGISSDIDPTRIDSSGLKSRRVSDMKVYISE